MKIFNIPLYQSGWKNWFDSRRFSIMASRGDLNKLPRVSEIERLARLGKIVYQADSSILIGILCWILLTISTVILGEEAAPCVQPCHAYAKLLPDDTLGCWHDACYWSSNAMEGDNEYMHPMPIYLPFCDVDVQVTNGYQLPTDTNDTVAHYGIDYSRPDDKTFPVCAAAAGKIIWVGYHPGPGNVVIIEHTPPEGKPFRTIYHHLRNGRDNDIDLAQRTGAFLDANPYWPKDASTMAWQEAGDRGAAILSAQKGDWDWLEQQFGTNAQKILVSEGQIVAAKQQIGWAGNTGIHCKGIHLHFMIAREVPLTVNDNDLQSKTRWILLNPYLHTSLFAPTFEDFVDLGLPTFSKAVDYFSSCHYFPATLSINHAEDEHTGVNDPFHKHNIGDIIVSGSFQYSPARHVITTLRSLKEQQQETNRLLQEGLRPTKIFITTPLMDTTRFSTLYTTADDSLWTAKHKMTLTSFNNEFGKHYAEKYLLTDYRSYTENGKRYFAATWEKPPQWHHHSFYYDLTKEQLIERIEKFKSKRLFPVVIRKYDLPKQGKRYAALWHYLAPEEEIQVAIDLPIEQFYDHRNAAAEDGFIINNLDVHQRQCTIVYKKTPAEIPPKEENPPHQTFWDFLIINRLNGDIKDMPLRGEIPHTQPTSTANHNKATKVLHKSTLGNPSLFLDPDINTSPHFSRDVLTDTSTLESVQLIESINQKIIQQDSFPEKENTTH